MRVWTQGFFGGPAWYGGERERASSERQVTKSARRSACKLTPKRLLGHGIYHQRHHPCCYGWYATQVRGGLHQVPYCLNCLNWAGPQDQEGPCMDSATWNEERVEAEDEWWPPTTSLRCEESNKLIIIIIIKIMPRVSIKNREGRMGLAGHCIQHPDHASMPNNLVGTHTGYH